MVETLLSFLCPDKRDGFAGDAAGELGERPNDVSIAGDEARRLYENAKRHAEFRYGGGWDHASDGVEVLVS